MFWKPFTAVCVFAAGLASGASAATLTHSGSDFGGTLTSPFGLLAEEAGTAFLDFGVDYSYGNVEGVFNDPPISFCGINLSGICDLVTDVDGRIVETGTTDQGLTNFVEVTAGNAAPNTLTLSVFDIGMNLIGEALNVNGGSDTFSFLSGDFDIAFFSVSGDDTYGVRTVTIEEAIAAGDPPPAPVPLPAALPLLLLGLGGLGLAGRRRRNA